MEDEISVSENIQDQKKKKSTAAGYAVSFLIKTGVTVIAIWILLDFIIGVFVCHDNNAYPMIKDGDLCVFSRLESVHQGDGIIYRIDNTEYFGRIAAVGGEVVDIEAGSVIVDGNVFNEQTVYPTANDGSRIEFPYKVPEDCFFVLNDFRDNMNDSRAFGGIPLSSVKGKVILVLRRRGI